MKREQENRETKEQGDKGNKLPGLFPIFPLSFVLLKRLQSSPGLSGAIAVGLIVAVALATCVPLYADSVSHRLLMEQLSGEEERPPFAFLFRYIGDWHGSLEWEDIQAADEYLTTHVARELGLSLVRREGEKSGSVIRHVRTANWRLFPADEAAYADTRQPLEWLVLGFLDGLAAHAKVVEGQPLPTTAPSDEIPILVSQSLANRLGLQVGEAYLLFEPTGTGISLPVRITGIWRPLDYDPAYWPYLPHSFDEVLLTSESAFRDLVAPAVQGEIGQVVWYAVADGSHINSGDVPGLLARIAAVRARLDGLLPHATLDSSPEEPLRAYRQATTRLTLLLYAFSIPIMGLVLYFVTLVAGMVVHRQRGETVVLRSRGGTKGQVVGLYLLQWSLLGLATLVIGWPLGWGAAILVGRTRSFLAFAAGPLFGGVEGPGFHAPLNWTVLHFGLLAVGVSILAAILPALVTARHTVVTHQQELARTLRHPWWQRYFLDVILLIPAIYSYVLLRRPASPLSSLTQGDLFANPLLFLAPVLFIFSWALLLLRLLPRLMGGLARLSRRARGVVPLLVFHDLSLQAGQLAGPLLLLVLTTALATFSASLALTLDLHLHDRIYYRVGADLRLVEQGEFTDETDAASLGGGPFSPRGNAGAEEDGGWVFLPIAEHLELPGVQAAARVGDYAAAASLGGQVETGRFVGVDRLDFPGVAFFREDSAPQSLGALMNALAGNRRALLVERNLPLPGGRPFRCRQPTLSFRASGRFLSLRRLVGDRAQ
jgi:putative ABC transport system permease protein